jgi:hypothetical protein
MGQMYLQRFAYRDGATRSEIDGAWTEAFKTFARSGNWGGTTPRRSAATRRTTTRPTPRR